MDPREVNLLRASDERWNCKKSTIVEIFSQSFDTDRTGVGGSPYIGDMGAPGLRIPREQNGGQDQRYTYILGGVEVPGRCGIALRGLRQAVTLRAEVEVGEGNDAAIRVFERPVVTPFWSFPDGNVSWHLRWKPNKMNPDRVDAVNPPLPGQTSTFNSLDSALVYFTPPDGAAGTYVPMGAGIPPGAGVYQLGTFYDIRFPWGDHLNSNLNIPIDGAGVLLFMASVQQSDPVTRTATPACNNINCLAPEDQFLASFPDAVYGRVAGAMTVEMFPGC